MLRVSPLLRGFSHRLCSLALAQGASFHAGFEPLRGLYCTQCLAHTPASRSVLCTSMRHVPHRGECRTPAQLSGDVVQSLLAASQMTRCLAKHLLCGVLVSSEAYLVKLTEVDHLLMTSLSKVALLVASHPPQAGPPACPPSPAYPPGPHRLHALVDPLSERLALPFYKSPTHEQ